MDQPETPPSGPATDPLPSPHHPDPPEVRHEDGRIEHPTVHYERRDVWVAAVFAVIAVAVLSAPLGAWLILEYFWGWQHHEQRVKQSPYALAARPSIQLPLTPRLEQVGRASGDTEPDVFYRLADKEAILHSYGQALEPGYVHIPIERAIELVVDQLPVRAKAPPDAYKADGLLDAGESSSGRMFRGKKP